MVLVYFMLYYVVNCYIIIITNIKEKNNMTRPKKPGKYKYLNVAMPEELLVRLDDYSNATRIPKTAITEMALKEFLDKRQEK